MQKYGNNVRKNLSPLTYASIIIAVIIISSLALLLTITLNNTDNYKKAELNYFAALSLDNFNEEEAKKEYTSEFDMEIEVSDYIGEMLALELNKTHLSGMVSSDGENMNGKLDYFNGNKKVLGINTFLENNLISVIIPEITDYTIIYSLLEDLYNTDEFDYEMYKTTVRAIVEKYFEIVGDPEIINKKVSVYENGINIECVQYRVIFDADKIYNLLHFAIEEIYNNENLVNVLQLNEYKDYFLEMLDSISSDLVVQMDVFAKDNQIVKRVFEINSENLLETITVTVLNLKEDNREVVSVTLDNGYENYEIINDCVLENELYSGNLSLVFGEENLMSSDFISVDYEEVRFSELYGLTGKFNANFQSGTLSINAVLEENNDELSFDLNIGLLGQTAGYIKGVLKNSLQYTEIEMPESDPEMQVFIDEDDIYNQDRSDEFEEIGRDLLHFIDNVDDNFKDSNGNLDLIGYIVFSLSEIFYMF